MNKFILIINFFLFSVFTVIAQTAPNLTDIKGKKQGHWIKYDNDKKKIYDGNFSDGIPVGIFTYYYDSGIPWSITVFSNNGKTARTKMFDAAGKITGEGKYIDEKKDSLWKFYNQDGKLIAEDIYMNDRKSGLCKVYYPNGQIAEEKNWKDGLANGVCKKYFENGKIKYQSIFINNKLEGKVTFYYASGKIDAEGVYKNDMKDGIWNYFEESGKVKQTDIYIEGVRQNKNKDENVYKHEDEEKAKKQYEQFEIKDPFQEGYTPH